MSTNANTELCVRGQSGSSEFVQFDNVLVSRLEMLQANGPSQPPLQLLSHSQHTYSDQAALGASPLVF